MKTEQEIIREGVLKILDGCDLDPAVDWAWIILSYLQSQGVVLKGERELPVVQWAMTGKDTPSQAAKIGTAFCKAYAGCVAVEPLVGEK